MECVPFKNNKFSVEDSAAHDSNFLTLINPIFAFMTLCIAVGS